MTRASETVAPPVQAIERILAAAAVLRAAEQLGLLAALARAPVTAEELSSRCGHDGKAVAVVLDALEALDVVEHRLDSYRCDPRVPALVATMRESLTALPERVRGGAPRLAGDRPGEAGELYGELAAPLGTFFGDAAEEVAGRLATPGLSVLDVGAGAAPWSRAIARRHPSIHVVACDLGPVLDATRTAVTDDGLDDQFDVVACDVLADPLPGGDHDLVIAANLCHLFDAAAAARLVRALTDAARPGGTVVVVDVLPEHQDPDRRRSVALYAAGLLTRTASGGVHPFEAYRDWLVAAGCRRVERHDCSTFPISVVTGRVG